MRVQAITLGNRRMVQAWLIAVTMTVPCVAPAALCSSDQGAGFIVAYNYEGPAGCNLCDTPKYVRYIAVKGELNGDTVVWTTTDSGEVTNWSPPNLGWYSFGNSRTIIANRFGIDNHANPARVTYTDKIGHSPSNLEWTVAALHARGMKLSPEQLTPGPHAVTATITIEKDDATTVFIRCNERGTNKYSGDRGAVR